MSEVRGRREIEPGSWGEGKVISSKRGGNIQDEGLMNVDVNMSEH